MKKQSGAALIVVLSLLTISLMVGLSSIQSSQIDERLAGNYRAQLQAQMIAEAEVVSGYSSKGLKDLLEGKSSIKEVFANEVGGSFSSYFNYGSWSSYEEGSDGLEEYEGLQWVACGSCDNFDSGGRGAHAFVNIVGQNDLGLSVGYYIIGVGALASEDGGAMISNSEPVFARLGRKFLINSAVNVLGGVKGLDGNSWYPQSKNSRISNGDDPNVNAMYYEGEAHTCEDEPDPQSCYNSLSPQDIFDGDVLHGSSEDSGLLDMVIEIFENFSTSHEDVVTSNAEDYAVPKKEECTVENSRFAFVETFSMSGSEKFCGVLIVWGGDVDIPVDVTVGGNASVEGMLLAANFDKKPDGSPDFSSLGLVDLKLRGGGEKGSVFFDRDFVSSAFGKAGLDADDFLPEEPGEIRLTGEIVSWR